MKLTEYECVLDYTKGRGKYPVSQELKIPLRNPDTMELIQAKAIIFSSFEEYPEADKLYYVSATAGREKEPVPIKVLEIIEEEQEDVKALPHQKLSLGERKGKMLSDMIKDRQEKKKH